jgi:pimeloyl-ACP methyl ester carboxylesterase
MCSRTSYHKIINIEQHFLYDMNKFKPVLLLSFLFVFVYIINIELQSPSQMSFNIFKNIFAETTDNSQPLVVTVGEFNLTTGKLLPGHSPIAYKASNIPGLQNDGCPKNPDKTVVYIHGYAVNGKTFASEASSDIFNRVKLSLENKTNNTQNNTINVIGFNWDSNILTKDKPWEIAKDIAKKNGLKLAQFILDFKNKCLDTDIRLIAHSLGARVALSSLDILHNNPEWNAKNYQVKSVHLLGAAVDNEEITKNPFDIVKDPMNGYNINIIEMKYPISLDKIKSAYGQAVEDEVEKFYNFFSPKDDSLEIFYPLNENNDSALGLTGAEKGISLPNNYIETNVQSQIKPFCDADGHNSCDYPYNIVLYSRPAYGDNHFGYIGFMNANGTLKDDGAMDEVVKNWGSE